MIMNACATYCLRAVSLIYGIEALILMFAPEYFYDLTGVNPSTWSKLIKVDNSVNSVVLGMIASFSLAISVVSGYGATFQLYGDKVKLARGLCMIHCYMFYVHIKDAMDGHTDVYINMTRLYAMIGFHALFAIWTLTIAFSTSAAHQQHEQQKSQQKKTS